MNVPHTQRQDLVPGVMRCAKCEFQLYRTNLNMGAGTVTAGNSNTEPCPNGCGPLWPVTWKQWAEQLQDSAERLAIERNDLLADAKRWRYMRPGMLKTMMNRQSAFVDGQGRLVTSADDLDAAIDEAIAKAGVK